jgi:hypothetical protein
LVYLAHVGCWIPCERAIIGLTDRIFTRIGSVETISNPLSSFAIDLTQVGCSNYILLTPLDLEDGGTMHQKITLSYR